MYGGKGKSIGKKRVTVVGGSDGVNAPPQLGINLVYLLTSIYILMYTGLN